MINNRNIINQAPDSVNVSGDNNDINVNIIQQSKTLNRTFLYEYCNNFEYRISEQDRTLQVPSNIMDKISFNQLNFYKIIFENYSIHLDSVEQVLAGVSILEKIVNDIHFEYLKIASSNNVLSGDEICEKIFEYLYTKISNDPGSKNLIEEDVKNALYSLMYYVFIRCKILKPVQ